MRYLFVIFYDCSVLLQDFFFLIKNMSDEHYEKLKIMYACLNKNCEKEEKASTKYLNNVRANKTELDKNNEALKARTRCATDKCARELKGVLEGMVKTSQDAIDLYLELKSKAKTPEEKDMIKNGINYTPVLCKNAGLWPSVAQTMILTIL